MKKGFSDTTCSGPSVTKETRNIFEKKYLQTNSQLNFRKSNSNKSKQ